MQNRQKDKRKSKGCPLPIVYLCLEVTALTLVLYMAYAFHIPLVVLMSIFAGFAIFALSKTTKVCARQRIYSQNRQ